MTDIIGTDGNDTLEADFVLDTVDAGAGDDLVIVTVGSQNDSTQGAFDGGDGFDTIDFSGFSFGVDSGVTPDGENILVIDGFHFGFGMLMATFSNFERIIGSNGRDSLIANGSLSVFDGGGSRLDSLSYSFATEGILVNLETGLGFGGAADGHQIINIEIIFATRFDDILLGFESEENNLFGGGGDDSLVGGSDRDTLTGGDGNDTIQGGDDDDKILGGDGRNLLVGGDGNDTFEISGNISDNTIQGGEGRDRITNGNRFTGEIDLLNGNISGVEDVEIDSIGGRVIGDHDANRIISKSKSSSAFIVANGGDDTISTGSADDFIAGGDGNDLIAGLDGNDQIFAGPGDTGADTIFGGNGDDTLGGGAGDDFIIGGGISGTGDFFDDVFDSLERTLGGGSNVIFGGAGDDTLLGGFFRDTVVPDGQFQLGEAGQFGGFDNNFNTIWGGTGNDVIFGALRDDTLGGGQGDDRIGGGGGNDIIYGGRGDENDTGNNDTLSGGLGNDTIFASGGNDILFGGHNTDELYGQDGNDTIDGGPGDDIILGGDGDDDLFGGDAGDGLDELFRAGGFDSIAGGLGNDFIRGGEGSDTLIGDEGDDTLIGGTGGDSLIGAEGTDTFIFEEGHGADRVGGFTVAEDILDLSGTATDFTDLESLLVAAEFREQGRISGVMLDTGDGDSIFLEGLTVDDLSNINIVF
jgi:Ca2+-binding RTX toxin-like protein